MDMKATSALIVVVAAGEMLAGQGQPARTQVFRAGVDMVAINVSVVDKDGRPRENLGADQFEVTFDGQARPVVSAEFVAFSTRITSASPGAEGPSPVLSIYSSNEKDRRVGPPVRRIIVAVDQDSFRPEAARAVVAAAKRFVNSLGPDDRVALVSVPPPGPTVGFTRRHDEVRTALDGIRGRFDPPRGGTYNLSLSEAFAFERGDSTITSAVLERECTPSVSRGAVSPSPARACGAVIQDQARELVQVNTRQAQQTLIALRRYMDSLRMIDGPKTMVLVSGGLVLGELTSRSNSQGDLSLISEAAAAADVGLYVLQLSAGYLGGFDMSRTRIATTPWEDDSLRTTGLETLAGRLRGAVFKLLGGADSAFDRIALETSGYYVLGVTANRADFDGKSHRIRVRVRTPNLVVRSREELVVPLAAGAGRSDADLVAEALGSPQISADLPLRLATTALGEGGAGRIKLVMSALIGRAVASPADVHVGYLLTDANGRPAGRVVERQTLRLHGSGEDAAWSYVAVAVVNPGLYLLKFAAIDSEGRIGSVEHPVSAQLTVGSGMVVSDLMLNDPARAAVSEELALIPDGRLLGRSLGAYLEMYPTAGRRPSEVDIQIVEAEDGPPLLTTAMPLRESTPGPRWTSAGEIDLSALPPGEYTAVAVVRSGDAIAARVARPFRLDRVISAPAGGPSAPLAFNATGALLRRFRREDVLQPDILRFFVSRMQATDSSRPSAAVSQAIENARVAKFDPVMADLAGAGSDQLSVEFLRGLAAFAKGDLEPAAGYFRQSMRISADFLPAAFYLGACYAAGGRDREAAGAWRTSLITESDAMVVYEVLADALLRLQDGAGALAILREATGRWPDADSFLPRLAAAHAIANARDEAFRTLKPYLERHPDAVEPLFLATRLLYDAHSEGSNILSEREDRELIARYAGLYKTAGGPNSTLVARWVQFVQQSSAKK
jgi:VWFA-related protein